MLFKFIYVNGLMSAMVMDIDHRVSHSFSIELNCCLIKHNLIDGTSCVFQGRALGRASITCSMSASMAVSIE